MWVIVKPISLDYWDDGIEWISEPFNSLEECKDFASNLDGGVSRYFYFMLKNITLLHL